MSKAFFIDLTLCTACRGCQVACKQWKKLPAEETRNIGSHQNPQDLSSKTYKLVQFKEIKDNHNKIDWVFFPEQCRHCYQPPCFFTADSELEGSVIWDEETGAVVFTGKTAEIDFNAVRESCPYDIPRKDEETGIIHKCDMCNDRVHEGKLPSCVLTCPTGAMSFGNEDEMIAKAEARLEEVKERYPDATLGDPDQVRVIYLFPYEPTTISPKAIASLTTHPMSRRNLFASLAGKSKRV